MKENNNDNDFLLEGLNQEEYNKNKKEGNEPKFIDGSDNESLSKSTAIKMRSTVMFPKSRYHIGRIGTESKKHKFEQTIFDNQLEDENEDEYEYDNEDDHIINNSPRYLFFDDFLNLEDPFTRVSRPSAFDNKRISGFNRRKKNKKKNNFIFDKKKTLIEQNIDDENNRINNLIIENQKIDKEEPKTKNEDEKSDNNDIEFVNMERPSFLSRNSIDLEEETFEVEVIDSVWLTVLQVINCMIKANLVQIAISMKELGLIFGPIAICTIALMSLVSLALILEVNQMTGQRSYLIFSEMLFGHFGSIIILIFQFMSAFGGCLSFIVIFNKVVPKLLNFTVPTNFVSNETIFSILLGFVMYFYCYKQDVNIIKSAAKYAVFGILLFFVVTITDFIIAVLSQDRLVNLNNYWNKDTVSEILYGLNRDGQKNRISNIITAIACIILSYSFHVFTFSIYGCMGKISKKQFFMTTSISVLITTIIYLICGIIGYLLYYDELQDSILDCIQESWSSSLLSLANVINVIMTFPITFAAVKNYFMLFTGIIITLFRDLFLWMFSCIPKFHQIRNNLKTESISKVFKKENKSLIMSGNPLVKMPKFMEFLLTTLIYCLIFYVASKYNQLKIIFSITGGVMGNILSFIFPSIFYLCFSKKKCSKYGIFAIFFIFFGIVTMLICIFSTLGLFKNLNIE